MCIYKYVKSISLWTVSQSNWYNEQAGLVAVYLFRVMKTVSDDNSEIVVRASSTRTSDELIRLQSRRQWRIHGTCLNNEIPLFSVCVGVSSEKGRGITHYWYLFCIWFGWELDVGDKNGGHGLTGFSSSSPGMQNIATGLTSVIRAGTSPSPRALSREIISCGPLCFCVCWQTVAWWD